MLALVLEGTRMLGLDVHMYCALVLLDEGAMRALKLTGLGANVFEGHCWGPADPGRKKFNFCGPHKNWYQSFSIALPHKVFCLENT